MAGRETAYKLVQLKQLSNHEKDKKSPQDLVNQIQEQYGRSPDLLVGVWIFRDIIFNIRQLDFSRLHIEQIWFFGESQTGEVTIEGGHVRDLVLGICWYGAMKNGVPQIPKLYKFK